MAVTIQTRRDDSADWTAANPVLALGEIGIETDTDKAKYGDGFTAWNDLDYWIDQHAIPPVDSGTLDGQTLRWETTSSAWEATSDLVVSDGGNVGIGTGSPGAKLHVSNGGTIVPSGSTSAIFVGQPAGGATNNVSIIGGSSASSRLNFGDTTAETTKGWINYSNGGNNMTFGTANTEAMRIDSVGNVLVALTSAPNGSVNGSQIGNNGVIDTSRASTASNAHHRFYNTNGLVGQIVTNGSTTTYATSSDARLKENIEDADSPFAKLNAIQVRKFDWRADGSHQDYGFIAQELVKVVPGAVVQGETEDDTWGVDPSKLVPLLVKSIQELTARVEELDDIAEQKNPTSGTVTPGA